MVEGSDAYGLVDASKMNLVPDLVLPPKFKVPTFESTMVRNARQHTYTCIAGK